MVGHQSQDHKIEPPDIGVPVLHIAWAPVLVPQLAEAVPALQQVAEDSAVTGAHNRALEPPVPWASAWVEAVAGRA